MSTKQKKKTTLIVTPVGRVLYPNLAEPDTRGDYGKDKFKVRMIFSKKTWKDDPAAKKMRADIIKEARKFFNDPSIKKMSDFKGPIKDGDKKYNSDPTKDSNKALKDHYFMDFSTGKDFPPNVVGPKKNKLDKEATAKIKSGDYGRVVASVKGYHQSEGGITTYLQTFQLSHEGDRIGGSGNAASMALLDELDVELDDVDGDDDDSDVEDGDEGDEEEDEELEEENL